MPDPEEPERVQRERAVAFVQEGAELVGPMAGGTVGLLGGPLGVLAGTAVGWALQRALVRLSDEFAQRQLGPRQRTRAGAALYFALEDLKDRLAAGETLRADGFFDEDEVSGRSRADEVLETVLRQAIDDHEELKVRHLGWMLSAFAFRPDFSPAHSTFLTALAGELTFQQLAILALIHESPYRSLPSWQALHPFDYRAHALAGQVFDLAQRGVLFRTDGHPVREYSEADPSLMRVGVSGHILVELMRLDRIEPEVLHGVREELEAVSDMPTPTAFLGHFSEAVDSAKLAETDILEGVIRLPLESRAGHILPTPGSEPAVVLRGAQISIRYELDPTDPSIGLMTCTDSRSLEHLRSLVEPGTVLRLSRGHDGTYWID